MRTKSQTSASRIDSGRPFSSSPDRAAVAGCGIGENRNPIPVAALAVALRDRPSVPQREAVGRGSGEPRVDHPVAPKSRSTMRPVSGWEKKLAK